MLLSCNVISRRVSTANFACWLALSAIIFSLCPRIFLLPVCLIRCNLVSLSLEVSFPFFHILFRCNVAYLSLAVWVARFTQSLTLSFSTFRSFGLLSLQHVGLCLFLCDCRSSCSNADWASLHQLKWKGSRVLSLRNCFRYFARTDQCAQMFRVKRVSTCIYGMTYVRQIYNNANIWKSTFQHTSVGLAQARPN